MVIYSDTLFFTFSVYLFRMKCYCESIIIKYISKIVSIYVLCMNHFIFILWDLERTNDKPNYFL